MQKRRLNKRWFWNLRKPEAPYHYCSDPLRILVLLFITQTPILVVVVCTATLSPAPPESLAALLIGTTGAVISAADVVELNGLAMVGLEMISGIDERGKNAGVGAPTGACVVPPLVEELLADGAGKTVRRLWPGVVTGPVRVGRLDAVGREDVMGEAEGRVLSSTLAQVYMSVGRE